MFDEKQRNIFKYHDGFHDRFADPVNVWRNLIRETDGNLDQYIREAKDRSGAALESRNHALDILTKATRIAFELSSFLPEDGDGVLEEDCIRILVEFVNWIKKKGQNTVSGPKSPPYTEFGDRSPMTSSLASTSTRKG